LHPLYPRKEKVTMQSKNNIVLGLADLKRVLGLASILAVFLLISLVVPQASAKRTSSSFDATFAGDFWLAGDVAKSKLFIVEESGVGNDQTFGDFTYTTYLLHNLARIPPGCGPGSSTGVDGSAVLTLADGQIRLKRISATACFLFPIIDLEEQWVIASGTGNYVGATGILSRKLDGDVIPWTTEGKEWLGTIKLRD
jgi:hypothetical protein